MVAIIYIAIWEKKLRSIQLQNYDFVASSEAEKNVFITKTCINEQLERKYVPTFNHSSSRQALLRSS